MKAVVTGATGFLGMHVSLRLKEEGYEVFGIGRKKDAGVRLVEQGISFIQADLSERDTLRKTTQGADCVVHCAALSSPWGLYEDFYRSNVEGTQNMIDASIAGKAGRFIHISTPSIYFGRDHRLNVKEQDPLPRSFLNDYARTKWLAEERVVRALEAGLPAVTIRPRGIFGPGDNAILPRLMEANEQRFVPLINGGEALIDLTYVSNVVDAIVLAIKAPESCIGETYNITNGQPTPLKDLLALAFRKLGTPCNTRNIPYPVALWIARGMEGWYKRFQGGVEPPLTVYTVTALGKSQTISAKKAKQELTYTPSVSIDEGLDHFIKWWRNRPCGM